MFVWKAIISPLGTASYYIMIDRMCALCSFGASEHLKKLSRKILDLEDCVWWTIGGLLMAISLKGH